MSVPPDWKRAPEFGDPYPGYAWLRENDPVHWSESLRAWVITRYDDMREVFDRPTRFSSDRFRKLGAQYASQREAVVAVGRVQGDWMVLCLSAPLARMEAMLGFDALLARFPRIEALDQQAAWKPLIFFRALERLRVGLEEG